MNKLICMVGISASGKSTIAKQLSESENAIIVSSDAIRGELCNGNVSDQSKNDEVFKLLHRRIKENLRTGNNVIVDCTNIKIKSRKAILNCANGIDCEKIAYIVPKKIEDCIRDNQNSDRTPVPEEVIRRQMSQFEIPFYEEGWNDIIIHYNHSISFDKINNHFMSDLSSKMNGFDQKNPHHTEDLLSHCITVHDAFIELNYSLAYKWAALYHDVGKLFTQTFDENGIAHYYQHHAVGCYYLLSNIASLVNCTCMNDKEALDMLFLVNYHMYPFNWQNEKTHSKYKKLFGEEKYQMLIDFNKCDQVR